MAKETITPEMMTIEKPEMMAQETMTPEMKTTEIITQEMMMRGMMRTDNKTMTTEKVYMTAQETKMMTLETLEVMTRKTVNYPYGRLNLMEMCLLPSPEMKTPDMP